MQWLAPLASEAPEFIVAILFALHGKGSDAIGTLISSKVSQWTLLVGSIPIAYLVGGGGTALVLDPRQVEEVLLTAAQTLLGVAALLTLGFPRWLAFTLLGLFAVQYALPGQAARYLLSAVYLGIAAAALLRHRRHILPALAADSLGTDRFGTRFSPGIRAGISPARSENCRTGAGSRASAGAGLRPARAGAAAGRTSPSTAGVAIWSRTMPGRANVGNCSWATRRTGCPVIQPADSTAMGPRIRRQTPRASSRPGTLSGDAPADPAARTRRGS